jgi:gluconokinase
MEHGERLHAEQEEHMVSHGEDVTPGDAGDPLVLTIDVGSSSIRAGVSDHQGRSLRGWVARRSHDLDTDQHGAATVDPVAVAQLIESCLDELLPVIARAGRSVAAVSCDTFWHSLMGLDAHGVPTSPVFTWADTRSVAESRRLQSALDARAVHERTGAGLYANYLPAKLLWLRLQQPDVVSRTAWWMSFGEYVYFLFFGDRRVSISMASGSGLFDQRRCVWDEEVLDAVGVPESTLSPVAEYSNAFDSLKPEYAQRWPALAHVPWYLPIGDGAANNIGSGGTTAERAVVMIGTSGAIRVVRRTETFTVPEGLWTYRVDGKRIVQGGAMSAGGNVFAWLLETLKTEGAESLDDALQVVPPDSHGLTVLPFLAGERSPGWLADARAAIVGMTLATTPAQIARATIEAVTYRFALVFTLLVKEIGEVRGIIGSGAGMLHSPAWMEIMTDVLGRQITASAVDEATCRGTALLALEALGAVPDLADLPVPLATTYTPDPAKTAIYQRAIQRQNELYDALLLQHDHGRLS